MKKTTVKQTTSKQDASNPELPGKVEAKVNPEAKQDHDPAIRILKIATCPTLSGKSELVYHLGCNTESEALFRVVQNSGNGQFNADWVSLAAIEKLLTDHPADKPLTSRVLQPVFHGRSSNSGPFVFACLKAEGLVKAGTEKESGYLLGDIEAFKSEITALIAAGTDLNVSPDTPPEPTENKDKAAK